VTDHQLRRRALTGVAPDGHVKVKPNGQVILPPLSSAFLSEVQTEVQTGHPSLIPRIITKLGVLYLPSQNNHKIGCPVLPQSQNWVSCIAVYKIGCPVLVHLSTKLGVLYLGTCRKGQAGCRHAQGLSRTGGSGGCSAESRGRDRAIPPDETGKGGGVSRSVYRRNPDLISLSRHTLATNSKQQPT
jgi:hypothetical protein